MDADSVERHRTMYQFSGRDLALQRFGIQADV